MKDARLELRIPAELKSRLFDLAPRTRYEKPSELVRYLIECGLDQVERKCTYKSGQSTAVASRSDS